MTLCCGPRVQPIMTQWLPAGDSARCTSAGPYRLDQVGKTLPCLSNLLLCSHRADESCLYVAHERVTCRSCRENVQLCLLLLLGHILQDGKIFRVSTTCSAIVVREERDASTRRDARDVGYIAIERDGESVQTLVLAMSDVCHPRITDNLATNIALSRLSCWRGTKDELRHTCYRA